MYDDVSTDEFYKKHIIRPVHLRSSLEPARVIVLEDGMKVIMIRKNSAAGERGLDHAENRRARPHLPIHACVETQPMR